MQTSPARLRQGILERAAGKLVPEGQRTLLVSNHSDAQATVDSRLVELTGLLQQPQLRLSGDHADEFRDFARRRRKPDRARQHRVAHGGRHRIGHCSQDFGDE